MAIRIGRPGRYQQQSLYNDKLQLYTPSMGYYSQHTAHPYQKTRQILWLLEKVVNIKRTARWNLMCSVKRQYRYQRPDLLDKKKSPHNVENRSTGHTQQVIYSLFFCFLSDPRASSGHCECNRERRKKSS